VSRFGWAAASLSAVLLGGAITVFNLASGAGTDVALASTTPATTTTSDITEAVDHLTTTTVGATTTASTASSSTGPTTTTSPQPTTKPATTARTPDPPFQSGISTVTEADLFASWSPGCPLAVDALRLVEVSHWGFDGVARTGEMVVAADLASDVIAIFHDLFDARYPIERMELVDVYGGDDDSSMAANNTSAFNCRTVTGGSSFSEHSYGRAIDLNPLVNPYVNGGLVLPPAGQAFVDRSLDAPGMIHAGDEVVLAFAARGWIWGGTWTSLKDYQHFSTTGK